MTTLKTIAGACVLALLAAFAGPRANPAAADYGPPIGIENARKVMTAAEAEAGKNNWAVVIAIIDSGGHVVMLHRRDDVQLASLEIAQGKAKTALKFKRPTKVLDDAISGGGAGLRFLALKDIMPLEGGMPIVIDSKIVGAIGISGVLSAQDAQIARAGSRRAEVTGADLGARRHTVRTSSWSRTRRRSVNCCSTISASRTSASAAPTAATALRRLVEREMPALVLLDVGLPGEDGFALARWLREKSGRIGIIMVTAATDTVDRVVGLETGADDYIGKPYEPRELLARVKSVLRRVTGAAAPPGPRVRMGRRVLDLEKRVLVDPGDGERGNAGGERVRSAQGVRRESEPAAATRLAAGGPRRTAKWRRSTAPSTCASPACAARSRSTRRIRTPSAPCAASGYMFVPPKD